METDENYVTYYTMYGEKRSVIVLVCTGVMLLIWIAFRITESIKEKRNKEGPGKNYFDSYLVAVLLAITFSIMFNPSKLGLPSLVAGSRLCSIGRIFNDVIIVGTADFILFWADRRLNKVFMASVAICCMGGVYAYCLISGNYHGFLFNELRRYNSAVLSTVAITSELDPKTYTIVATTDEIYQVIEKGFHEE